MGCQTAGHTAAVCLIVDDIAQLWFPTYPQCPPYPSTPAHPHTFLSVILQQLKKLSQNSAVSARG